MPASESFRIPKNRSHVPVARQHVRKTLAGWGITDELADAVTLLANEPVTNAVTHCKVSHSQIKVELTLTGAELVLEVSDPDRNRLPRPHDSTPDEEGGRGPRSSPRWPTTGDAGRSRTRSACGRGSAWRRSRLMFRRLYEATARLLTRPTPLSDTELAREVRTPDPYVWRLPPVTLR